MINLIFMLPNNLGDVIMALPALRAAKSSRHDASITFLVEEGYEAGLEGSPWCDRIVTIPRRKIKERLSGKEWEKGTALLTSTIGELKSGGCDAVINLSQHPYLSYVASLIGAPRTLGRQFLPEGNHALMDEWSQYLYAIPFARECNGFHTSDIYSRIAGYSPVGSDTFVTIKPDEKRRSAEYLANIGCPPAENRIAVLQPGAAWHSKRWGEERFIALGKLLVADGWRVVLTGAAAERSSAKKIAGSLGAGAFLAAGDLSFRGTMALLPHARLVVSGDTALMHAAASLGVATFALFGPTNPVETGPYGKNNVVFAGKCPRRPCFNVRCPLSHECMGSISPEAVFAAIRGERRFRPDCDTYVTGFNNGDFCLEPVGKTESPGYDRNAFDLTKRVFDPECKIPHPGGDFTMQQSSTAFAGRCIQMAQTLDSFFRAHDPDVLRTFERQRMSAAQNGGIVAFWNALLNIRLNSIPMLEPSVAIRLSARACQLTGQQILRIFSE